MTVEPVFFDTNTLVYANDTGSPKKRARARELIHQAVVSGTGSIPTQVLAKFWLTVTRKLKTPRAADSGRADHEEKRGNGR